MKRLTALLLVVAMTICGATAVIAADLPQAPQGVMAGQKALPDAELAQLNGRGLGPTNPGLQIAYDNNSKLALNGPPGLQLHVAGTVISQLLKGGPVSPPVPPAK
jgi:hypothetical protein